MKKIIMLLAGLMMASLVQAAPLFKEGEHYEVVKQTTTAKPEVLEFFSYFCPHCYHFEPIVAELKKSLPQGVEFKRNPVAFLGREMGPELQRAYAVATLLDVEAKFSPVIFKQIQVDRKPPQSRADIKAVFESIGVAGSEYEGAVDSFAVTGLVAQYDRNTAEMQIRGVPATVVNGRYLVKAEAVKSAEEYQSLIQFLLNKKD
jgi:protein dithiol oxidoreductase (disulfide-forming)